MKKEIVDYIKKLAMRKKPLTKSQVKTVAYWELVAFADERRGYCGTKNNVLYNHDLEV